MEGATVNVFMDRHEKPAISALVSKLNFITSTLKAELPCSSFRCRYIYSFHIFKSNKTKTAEMEKLLLYKNHESCVFHIFKAPGILDAATSRVRT